MASLPRRWPVAWERQRKSAENRVSHAGQQEEKKKAGLELMEIEGLLSLGRMKETGNQQQKQEGRSQQGKKMVPKQAWGQPGARAHAGEEGKAGGTGPGSRVPGSRNNSVDRV